MTLRYALLAAAMLATLFQAQENTEESVDAVDRDLLSHEQLMKLHSLVDANTDGKMSMQELIDFAHRTRALSSVKDGNNLFEDKDTNKDGKLSFDEIQAEDMDTEGFNEDEKKWINEALVRERAKFEFADVDKDGTLSKEEAVGLFYPDQNEKVLRLIAEQTFEEKDRDKDGSLSPKEFWQGNPADEDEALLEQEMKEFESLDKDRDGTLNIQEMMQWEAGVHFTKTSVDDLIAIADKNSDGHITGEELTGARELLSRDHAGYQLLDWVEHHEL